MARSSARVCGPRSISTAKSAAAGVGTFRPRAAFCSYLLTRPPLLSNTRLMLFSPSMAASTSASLASVTGSRAVFWLQPATSELSDNG